MPRAARALLVAPLLALAACAAVGTAAGSASMTSAHAHSDQVASGQVPATARMICGDDIKRKAEEALSLDTPPVTHDSWVDGVYTCHYSLPMGEMTLSDQVFADASAAGAYMAVVQTQDRTTQPLAGLGQRAYGNDHAAVVLKDNQVLIVDTSHLPEQFGVSKQRRTDLAYEVASDVLGCWTGDE